MKLSQASITHRNSLDSSAWRAAKAENNGQVLRLLITLGLYWLALYPLQAQNLEINRVPFQFRDNPTIITSMVQDEKGYIWMSDIGGGLFRYDGANLTNYSAEAGNPNSLLSNRVECIALGPDGSIWMGYFSHGLSRYDPEAQTFTHYRHDVNDPASLRSNAVRALVVDSAGMVWIGAFSGLDKLDPESGTITHQHTNSPDEQILGKEHIRVMYMDKSGILWIGTSSPFAGEETAGGLFKFDMAASEITRYAHSKEETSLIDNRVRALFEDSRGNFWVGTAGDGLHTMDRESGTFTRHRYDPNNISGLSRSPAGLPNSLAVDHITFINEDNVGNIWIGTYQGGLSRYDPQKGISTYYSMEEKDDRKLTINSFWAGLKTRDQLLWMSSWSAQSADNLLFMVNAKSTKVDHVTTVIGDTRSHAEVDDVLFHGGENGLWRQDGDGSLTNIFQPDNLDLPGLGVNQMVNDETGDLWVATGEGLYRYNLQSDALKRYVHDPNDPASLSHSSVLTVYPMNDDASLVVGTLNGLNIMDKRSETFRRIDYVNTDGEVIELFINFVLQDSYGELWVGTAGYGLRNLDLDDGSFKDYLFSPGSHEVFSIMEDHEQNLWVATSNGLHRYDREADQFVLITDLEGNLTELTNVFEFAQDKAGKLWLNAGSGVLSLDTETRQTINYGISWGINSGFTTRSVYATSKGEILVGTSGGYHRIVPEEMTATRNSQLALFVNKLYIDNELIRPESGLFGSERMFDATQINLSHDQNNIALEVVYIDFLTDAGQKGMQHRLDGYDNVWRNINSGELASYYNVPPGDYTFQIRGLDLYGNWSEKTLSINIAPPWWLTWWAYVFYFVMFITGVFVVHNIQKARVLRKERERTKDKELAQAKEIEKAYTELKTTQTQLIHSEKMASLGELTAGIAHEIQNPLNFVNNFSDINKELVDELEQEIEKGDKEEIKAILKDLRDNEEKVTHHGKRAEGIVKSMLQHSRGTEGEKELTDINDLCDEYLRLAYHGFRAKDQSFNCDYKLELDPDLPKIEVVPQDIGRVLLNLINNAFQAVSAEADAKAGSDYSPLVTVSTNKSPLKGGQGDSGNTPLTPLEGGVEIRVTDNGPGIPDEIKDKIFQPFFTTKDTGQGTGLGLSLSYDIVTKGHGGNLEVTSTAGQGATFVITLPIG